MGTKEQMSFIDYLLKQIQTEKYLIRNKCCVTQNVHIKKTMCHLFHLVDL